MGREEVEGCSWRVLARALLSAVGFVSGFSRISICTQLLFAKAIKTKKVGGCVSRVCALSLTSLLRRPSFRLVTQSSQKVCVEGYRLPCFWTGQLVRALLLVPRDCKHPAREGICHCEPIVQFVISRVYGYEFLPNGVHCSERPPKIQGYEARPYRGWFARLRTFYNSSILIHPSTHSFVRYSVPRYNRSCISFPLIYVASM